MPEKITDRYNLKEIERFHAGGESLKIRYEAYEKNSNKKAEVPMYIMRLNINYLRNWKIFKSIGLPVVEKIYTDKKNNFVYLPDVTSNGGSIYGKGTYNIVGNIIPHITDGGKRKNSHLDSLFLDIVTNRAEYAQLREITKYWSMVASNDNVFLPWDDPFDLVVNQNGKWGLISLDLETGGTNPKVETLSNHNLKLLNKPIYEANILISKTFLIYIDAITEKLLSK